MIALVLKYWRPCAALVLAVGLFAGGWFKGAAHVQARWDAERALLAAAAAKTAARQAEASVQVVTKYVDRVQVVHDLAAAIIKEVPVYVSSQADADCVLPHGFVILHDSAAAAIDPPAPGPADAAPSGVALSAATATLIDNYGVCHENAEQLRALQQWIREMSPAAGGDGDHG